MTKFWLRTSNSPDFIGPLSESELHDMVRTGTAGPHDEVIEATGQSLAALRRCTGWVNVSTIFTPDTFSATEPRFPEDQKTNTALQQLNKVRRNTGYEGLRSMLEFLWQVTICLIVFASLLSIILASRAGFPAFVLGIANAPVSLLSAFLIKSALQVLIDIADILLQQSSETKNS